MPPSTVLQRLAGTSLVRRCADLIFGRYSSRRVAFLDEGCGEQLQRNTLFRLVRHSAGTRFGRDHDFARIRTLQDYQQRVPLREYEAFWKDYWQPAFPVLNQVTWPEPIPYFALSSGTTSGTTKYIPVSHAMLASNRKAALTTLALSLVAHPETPLFAGRMFFLGGSTDLQELQDQGQGKKGNGGKKTPELAAADHHRQLAPILAGDLSGIAARELASILRPFFFPPLDLALGRDWDQKVQTLAEKSATLPITLVSGVPSWLLVLFDRLKRVTGRDRVSEIWPMLRIVVHGGTKFDPYRTLFQKEIGSDRVRYLETYPCSEGFVATEDPRHELLRLVPDHNIFFEFVPVGELEKVRPTRHTLADVMPGVQYAVVLTTCAGLWSYILGDTICFEKRDPPLFRFTGRTRYFLSAFGEHLISEEIERAMARAADATGATVVDFHVGPIFPELPGQPGRHRFLVEFAQRPTETPAFARELDKALCRINEDYEAHRQGGLNLAAPEVWLVRRNGFADWLRSRGSLGGQHKVPRMDNSGQLTQDIGHWLQRQQPSCILQIH